MAFFKKADYKIKEVITQDVQLSDFANRKAQSLSIDASKETEALRKVTAIEPNACYVVTVGLHGDIPNENGDYFEWEELLRKYSRGKFAGKYMFESWVGCPALTNHNPKNVVGEILDSIPNKEEKCIEFLIRVDEKKNSNLVKGLRNGSVKGTSMGVMVNHSYCSVCNHRAENEDQWCIHLSPRKLNIKGKKYTGQDGNKYPDKMGQLCYEINRDLEGVEDSFITLGEPADPDALVRTVIATTANKSNEGTTEMPKDVIKGQADARLADMMSDPNKGMHVGAPRGYNADKSSEAKNSYKSSNNAGLEKQLQAALQAQMKVGKVAMAMAQTAAFNTPAEVIQAIKEGSLTKKEAIDYVEKFQLVTADKLDDLSPSEAVKVLERSVISEKEHDDLVKAELACPPDPKNSKLADEVAKGSGPEENPPKAKGNMDAKDQLPGSKTSDLAVSESKAKPEEKMPKADGLHEPNKQMPNTETSKLADETNKSHTEAQKIKLDNDKMIKSPASDLAISLSDAKTQDEKPAPKGSMNPKNQLEGSETSTLSVKPGEAKPEDGQPNYQGNMNAKNQLEGSPASKLADETNKSHTQESKPAPVTGQKEEDSKPEPKSEDKSDKSEKKEAPKEGGDKPFGGDKGGEGKSEKNHPLDKAVDMIDGNVDIILKLKQVLKKLENAEHQVEQLIDAAPEAAPSPDASAAPVDSAPAPEPTPEPTDMPKPSEGGMDMMNAVAYKVDFIEDKETPLDSFYVVKNKEDKLFAFNCKDVYDEKPEEKFELFKSEAYKDELLKQLNAKGAKKVYEEHYAPRVAVIAQSMPEGTQVPNNEPQAGPANVDPNSPVGMDMANNNVQNTVTLDKFATAMASIIPNSDAIANGLSEVKSFLQDDSNLGAIAAKIKHILADGSGNSEVPKPNPDSALVPPAGPVGGPTPNPGQGPKPIGAMVSVPQELVVKASTEIESLRKALAEKTELLNKIEADQKLKARTSATLALAEKKAEMGLVEPKKVNEEAVRLAKLSDDDLRLEIKTLEDSVKIAKNLAKKADYINEGKPVTASTKSNINILPNQADPVLTKEPVYSWSKTPRGKYN